MTYIEKLLLSAVTYSGLVTTYGFLRRKITKSQVAILAYHRVCHRQNDWSLEPYSPQGFEKHIEYLCQKFEVVSLDKLVECLYNGGSFPEKAAVITIDDGYKDNYVHLYPILKKYHVTATIFLTTGHIGRGALLWTDKVRYIVFHTPLTSLELEAVGSYSLRNVAERRRAASKIAETMKRLSKDKRELLINSLLRNTGVTIDDNLGHSLMLSWDDVREMDQDGVSFGAHTVNHPILTMMPLRQARDEVLQSKRDIEEHLGHEIKSFSYPNGDFNAPVSEIVKDSGLACAVTTIPGFFNSRANPYELRRLGLVEDFTKFKALLAGTYVDLQRF